MDLYGVGRDLTPTLSMIRQAGLEVANAETSCHPLEYQDHKAVSALWGHCSAMAVTVQAALGGSIVTGRVKGVQHYWNRLPDGTEIDLTSCQFGGDGFSPLKKGRLVPPRKSTHPRFLLFASRIAKRLAGLPTKRTAE